MGKEFKKGQVVVCFCNYDSKGTWTWRRALVISCGAKRMHLQDVTTGQNMGADFRPNSSRTYSSTWQGNTVVQNYRHFTLADMSDAEAHQVALEAAAIYLDDQRAHYARCLAQGSGRAYDASIQRNLDALHEPRVIKG